MRNLNRKKIAIALAAIALLILAILISLNFKKKEEVNASEIGIKEIFGNTVEERLANHNIDVTNARITKIENAEQVRQQHSAIFRDAQNGNYLVETPNKVLIYDFEHDRIVAEFMVQNIDLGEGFVK